MITNTWPVNIPLPAIDHSGAPRQAVLTSSGAESRVDRRSRFQKAYASLSVSWMLTTEQMAAFETFYITTLSNGTAQFKLELRYPLNSALTEWAVRFEGEYSAKHNEGWWTVETTLDIINPI